MTSQWTAMKPTLTLGFQLALTSRSQFPTVNAFRLGSSTTSLNSPTFRLGDTERLRNHANLSTVSASNFNVTDANSPNGVSEADNTSNAAGGPPFLTIIAGLLVFVVLFWIASSIITLFFSLISKLLFGK